MSSDAMGTLPNAPLAYVLAQVVFQPMLNFSEKVPQIQEVLQRDFPRLIIMPKSLAVNIDEKSNTTAIDKPLTWEFISEDKHDAIRLMQNMMVFHTTKYEDYRDFSSRFEKAFSAVINVIGEPWIARQGMRYIDFLFSEDNRRPDFFVNNGFRSSQQLDLGESVEYGHSMSVYKLNPGKLVVKYIWGEGSPNIPDELQPITLSSSGVTKRAQDENVEISFLEKDQQKHRISKI